jgi:antitoxin HicB
LEEGGYSVTSPSLPGLVTEGETAGEALSNAREALRELIAEYKRSGEEIPWQTEIQESPGGVIEKRILVNA